MKCMTLVLFASLAVMGGCVTNPNGAKTASATSADIDDTYVPLGSAIGRKGKTNPDQTADLQQLENARLNTGTPRTGK